MEFLNKLMNILKNTKIEETKTNNTTTDTPTDTTTNNGDTTPITPTPTDDFSISYYMDQNHPITPANLTEFKKLGMTEVHFRADYGTTTAMKSVKNICDANGFKLMAWVWSDYSVSDAKILSDMGIGLHIDVETYDMPSKIDYIKQMYNATRNSSLEICCKATGWDGDMRYDLLAPICDHIVPMCYTGDYGQNPTTLAAFAKKWNDTYPGKFKLSLETYRSDAEIATNINALKTANEINAEIEAVKPYVDGVVLFRYGLSNFNGGITTSIGNTTETTPTTETPTQPTTLKGWVLTGYFQQDYQDTSYTCGPSSLQMVLSALGITAYESQLAVAAWTNTSGTGHDGLKNAVNTYAPTVKMTEYSASGIGGWSGVAQKINQGCEFIIHLWTGTLPNWDGAYGHYVFLQGVNVDTQTVRIFDPIKGNVEYSYSTINTAIANISSNSFLMFCKG